MLGLAAVERLSIVVLAIVLFQFLPSPGEYPLPEQNHRVGLHTFELNYQEPSGQIRTADAAVWYPSSEKAEKYNYYKDTSSYLAVDGALAGGAAPYPLIIFNHGFNASEMQSLFLKEKLASEGYIVASVHFDDGIWSSIFDFLDFDDYTFDSGIEGYLHTTYEKYFDTFRLPLASALLDYMLGENSRPESMFFQGIDPEAIGMGGHSFGGLTTLGLIGAHPDPEKMDPRVKAALLLSSPIFPYEENITSIDIPVMSMRGDYDLLLNRPEESMWHLEDEINQPYYYLVLSNADHFTFSETDAGLGWVPAANEKDEQLMTINEYSLAFFDLYLKKDISAEAVLSHKSPALALYISDVDP